MNILKLYICLVLVVGALPNTKLRSTKLGVDDLIRVTPLKLGCGCQPLAHHPHSQPGSIEIYFASLPN